MRRLFFPDRPEWDVQVMRLAAQATYGGSDIFECLAAARRIEDEGATEEAWRQTWTRLAEALVGSHSSDELGVPAFETTTGQRAARASSYFRTAEFFASYDSATRRPLYDAARSAFRRAIPYLPAQVEVLTVPDEDGEYDGYVFQGYGTSGEIPAPGVVFLGGADSYAEELFFFGGLALAQRGITVVVADTPGRGSSLRHKGIVSRPDYEKPAARVLDVLADLPFVDSRRLGVVGLSLGGYYAPRLAAADERVKACVCWCACFDVLEDVYLYFEAIQPQLRWIVGAETDEEARETLAAFRLDEVAPDIRCPILISHGEADEIMDPAGARRLFDAVTSSERHLRIWTAEEGGANHCSYDNWSACIPFMFDWLASRLRS